MNTRYVLLTAAKDEEACIGEVIQLVVRQTVLPMAWFIMDDGSSDQTAAIVQSFAAKYPFIRLESSGSRSGRNFGSRSKAIQAAYELVKPLEFDFVGVQDADQGPECEKYYESILGEFHRRSRLGVASGFVYERPRGGGSCGWITQKTRWLPAPCSAGTVSSRLEAILRCITGVRTGSSSSR